MSRHRSTQRSVRSEPIDPPHAPITGQLALFGDQEPSNEDKQQVDDEQ